MSPSRTCTIKNICKITSQATTKSSKSHTPGQRANTFHLKCLRIYILLSLRNLSRTIKGSSQNNFSDTKRQWSFNFIFQNKHGHRKSCGHFCGLCIFETISMNCIPLHVRQWKVEKRGVVKSSPRAPSASFTQRGNISEGGHRQCSGFKAWGTRRTSWGHSSRDGPVKTPSSGLHLGEPTGHPTRHAALSHTLIQRQLHGEVWMCFLEHCMNWSQRPKI